MKNQVREGEVVAFERTLEPHIWPITTNTGDAMNQSKFDAKASNRPAPARCGKNAHYPN